MMKEKKTDAYFLCGIIAFILVLVSIFEKNLKQLLYDPIETTTSWCIEQPCIDCGSFILTQPSSTFIVFFLSFCTIFAGVRFIRTHNDQKSRFWWGIFLILTGIGAGLAGISYQAFGYELKCRGNLSCIWTDWWEIAYEIFTVAGSGAAFIGVAYATFGESECKFWTRYAMGNSIVYGVLIVIGTIIPNRFLLSFEFMLIDIFIGGLILFIQNLLHYFRNRQGLFPKIMRIWILLMLVIVVYYIAYLSNLGPTLWASGIWFNENDVLHIMMLAWILYIYNEFGKHLKDAL